ncbi:hypothetical protein T02_11709 [Trichinella nativa]|uniref:Uncharacterized protein n=1 Tax=Trichinella nativa TaxID=6335 RepID=A0A0V1KPD7_9BILA|nr:hypothetical protein T02_11709 [Trichinella nativa]
MYYFGSVLLRLYWHAMNTYLTNANTTEISWAKLISLIYGSHENSNKNGKAGEAKIGAFMSHSFHEFSFYGKMRSILYEH